VGLAEEEEEEELMKGTLSVASWKFFCKIPYEINFTKPVLSSL
jgi:hypothetical protein